MAYGGTRSSSAKNVDKNKYQDSDRARFCKETTYRAEFGKKIAPTHQKNRQMEEEIITKYSNRVPKPDLKAKSAEKTKHRVDRAQSQAYNEKQVRHRYDYEKAIALGGSPSHGSSIFPYKRHLSMNTHPGWDKYHSKTGTSYQKDYAAYNSINAAENKTKGENWNIEKEHKIINPHNVEKLTINRIDYQPFTIQPREPKKLKAPSPDHFYPMKSSYQSEFQNWGPNGVIHEKDPKYPYYSLPFKGNT